MLLELRKASPKVVRQNKMVPGVIYGKNFESTSIKVDEKELHRAYQQYGQSLTFDVELEGKKHQVYIKDVQFELFHSNQIIHFDLMKITGDTLMTADIPVNVHGREEVEARKLFVEMVMQTVPAQYPADKAIASFDFDVTGFEANDAVHIKDIEVEEGVEILAESDQMIFIVKEPTIVEEVVSDDESLLEDADEESVEETEEE